MRDKVMEFSPVAILVGAIQMIRDTDDTLEVRDPFAFVKKVIEDNPHLKNLVSQSGKPDAMWTKAFSSLDFPNLREIVSAYYKLTSA